MTAVANKELCTELSDLSGWKRADLWVVDQDTNEGSYRYDLGYLLRKLDFVRRVKIVGTHNDGFETTHWRAQVDDRKHELTAQADTPEDAAALLAIKLFKMGILTRDDK